VDSRIATGAFRCRVRGLAAVGPCHRIVTEDQLFVKPTEAGRAFAHEAGETTEAPPYPGAKDYLLITDRIDDGP
jgi:hypothetical protein